MTAKARVAVPHAEPPDAKAAIVKPSRKRTSSIALAKHRKADTLVRDLRIRAEALLANADRLLHRLS